MRLQLFVNLKGGLKFLAEPEVRSAEEAAQLENDSDGVVPAREHLDSRRSW
jgi:hypothetical protein